MNKIEIRPPMDSEKIAVNSCIMKSFSKDPEQPEEQSFLTQFDSIPLERPDFCWAVFVDNKPVSALNIIPFILKIDKMKIKVAGLTGVGTDPVYRHQGYANQLMVKVHDFLRSEKFDGAVLHSSADMLYKKNGYEFAFCRWEGSLKFSKMQHLLADFKKACKDRDFEMRFFDTLNNIDVTEELAIELNNIRIESPQFQKKHLKNIRSDQYFFQKLLLHIIEGYVLGVLYRKQEPQAYIVAKYNEGTIEIIEEYSRNEVKEDFLCMWRLNYERFWEEKPNFDLINADPYTNVEHSPKNKIQFNIYPSDEVIISLIRNAGGEVHKNLLTGDMGTLFHPIEIMEKIKETLRDRLNKSQKIAKSVSFILNISDCKGAAFKIDVNTDKDVYINVISLGSQNTGILKVSIQKNEFVAIIFGYIPMEDTSAAECKDFYKLQWILEILFPTLEPVWDYFQTF